MLEIHHLRTDLENVSKVLAERGFTFPVAMFNALEADRKSIQTYTQELQAKRNAVSKNIGIKKSKGEDVTPILAQVANLGDELKQAEAQLELIQNKLQQILAGSPQSTTRKRSKRRQ